MKKLKKLVFGIVLLFQFGYASNFTKNEQLYLIDDKDYIIRCIEGYKWIQFINPLHGRGGTVYNPVGNPQQMFERERNNLGAVSVPIVCDKK